MCFPFFCSRDEAKREEAKPRKRRWHLGGVCACLVVVIRRVLKDAVDRFLDDVVHVVGDEGSLHRSEGGARRGILV